jgi:hypothetical protein
MNEAEKIIANNTGVQVSLTESLANIVTERFIGTLDDSILENTFKEMNHEYIDDFNARNVKIKRKNGNSYGLNNETYLGQAIRQTLADKYTDLIIEEANKYMETEEFKNSLAQMVADVIAYAVEGYKKDMIIRLKERLVGNAFSFGIEENGISIDAKIRDAIIKAKQDSYR